MATIEEILETYDSAQFIEDVEAKLESVRFSPKNNTVSDICSIVAQNRGELTGSIPGLLALIVMESHLIEVSVPEMEGKVYANLSEFVAKLGFLYRKYEEGRDERNRTRLFNIFSNAIEFSELATPSPTVRQYFHLSLGRAYLYRVYIHPRDDSKHRVSDASNAIDNLTQAIRMGLDYKYIYDGLFHATIELAKWEFNIEKKKRLLLTAIDCLDYAERLGSDNPGFNRYRCITYGQLARVETEPEKREVYYRKSSEFSSRNIR